MRKMKIIALMITVAMALAACGKAADADIKTEGEKTVLTLGTVSSASALQRQADAFNIQNTEYQIEIRSYQDAAVDGSNAINTIQMEISAGKGPDIIDFGYLYTPGAVSKGIMEDLSAYMEEDEDFHKEDYFENIINTFAIDNKLYVISPQFTINTVAVRKEDLGDAINWEIQDVMSYYQKSGQDKILFPGDSRKEVFGFLCMGSMGTYINWTDGSCCFDDGKFKELITFADQFPDYRIYDEDFSVLSQFRSGNALLYPLSVSNVYGCTKARMVFGDIPLNYIGYPLDGRNGSVAQPGRIILGINKNSKNKEASWQFIKSFLQEEYQSSIENGLPLLKSEMEIRLEKAQEIEYEKNETGEKVEKAKDSILFEGEDAIDIFCISKQDACDVLEIISNAETAYAVDYDLYSIILEEAGRYFDDGRDINSVIEIIQSRASIYISENYYG